MLAKMKANDKRTGSCERRRTRSVLKSQGTKTKHRRPVCAEQDIATDTVNAPPRRAA